MAYKWLKIEKFRHYLHLDLTIRSEDIEVISAASVSRLKDTQDYFDDFKWF